MKLKSFIKRNKFFSISSFGFMIWIVYLVIILTAVIENTDVSAPSEPNRRILLP